MQRTPTAPSRHASRSYASAIEKDGWHALSPLEPRRLLDGAAGTEMDDRFENNDSVRMVQRAEPGAADSPNLGELLDGSFTRLRNLRLHDRHDFFRFVLPAEPASGAQLRIVFKHRLGDLGLRLRDAGGQAVLAVSDSARNNETIDLSGLPPGAYFAHIRGATPGVRNTYTLTILLPATAPGPSDDAYERNNDSIDSVRALAEGAAGSANLGHVAAGRSLLNLKLNDRYDVYRFVLSGAGGAAGTKPNFVQITSPDPLDLVVFASDGTPVGSAEAYLGQHTVDLGGLASSEYFVQVSHYALGTAGSFDYSIIFI